MGADNHAVNALGDFHTAQAARERLFVNMGMIEFSVAEDLPVFGQDFPAIRIMIPAFIGVSDGNFDTIRPCAGMSHNRYVQDICPIRLRT